MKYLLVTNDFPPKQGGIQNYIYALWSRLDPNSFAVLTTLPNGPYKEFDSKQDFEVHRVRGPLLPTPGVKRLIERKAAETGANAVILDPALPLGLLGPKLTLPYLLMVHGAEATIPAKLPVLSKVLGHLVENSKGIIYGGMYVGEVLDDLARRGGYDFPPSRVVPPGCDVEYFVPSAPREREIYRDSFGVAEGDFMVLFVSRLVPRKGADTLIRAVSKMTGLHRRVRLVVVGEGRDATRLRRLADRNGVDVQFLGAVSKSKLLQLYQSADVFAMLSRDRWFGLEQEGFGIVFLEAQSTGVPVLVGKSGGSTDAVVPGSTGYLVERPKNSLAVAGYLERLCSDEQSRLEFSRRAQSWVRERFDYDSLALDLADLLESVVV